MRKTISYGLRPVSSILYNVSSKVIGKKGHTIGQLINDWRQIAGEKLSDISCPFKISFPPKTNTGATVFLHVLDSSTGMVIAHSKESLVASMNTYLGQASVKNIVCRVGPVFRPQAPRNHTPLPLSPQEESVLDELLEDFPEGPLRDSLASIGKALVQSEKNLGDETAV